MGEKAFDKIQHPFILTIPRKPGIEKNSLDMLMNSYKNLQLILYLVRKKSESFPVKSQYKVRIPTLI